MTTIIYKGVPLTADIRFTHCQIEGCNEPVAPEGLEWWRVGSARYCIHHYIEYLRFCVEVRRQARIRDRRKTLIYRLGLKALAEQQGRGRE